MKLTDLKDKYRGETAFILGNGPSLKGVELDKLQGKTFGMNRIYLREGFVPDFYVAVNPLVLEQCAEDIRAYGDKKLVKFFSKAWQQFRPKAKSNPANEIILDTTNPFPMFSTELKYIWEGFTVTYVAMQLAYHMGFSKVILLGMDHDFGKLTGPPNAEAKAFGVDENHFHPDYFSKGMKWNLPDLSMSQVAYSFALNAYRDAGRKLVNASGKTKLRTIPLENLNRAVQEDPPRVTAIVSAYKAKAFLQGCLMDLVDQTLYAEQDLEILVIAQEGSPEHEIVEKNWEDESAFNIHLILTPDIPTVYGAWEIGCKNASGKYLTNANADDRHRPDAFEIMANVLDANEHLDLVYHDSYITWEPMSFQEFEAEYVIPQKELVVGRHTDQAGIFIWPEYSKAQLVQGCFIGPQPMWRAELHQRFGHFNRSWKSAGDYDFWLRIADKDNMFHIPMALGLYHARVDGVELGDLETNTREAVMALNINQEPGGMEMRRQPDPEIILVMLAGNYGLVEGRKMYQVLRQQYAPQRKA